MSDMTVKDFASKVGRDVSRLLEQMQEAGLPHKTEGDAVSEEDKQRLLEHLTRSHGGDSGATKNRVTLTRNTKSRIRSGDGRGKAIDVQVRKKRTYVKRAEEEVAEQPIQEAAQHLVDHLLLRGEVVIQAARPHADAFADVAHGRGVDAPICEQCCGDAGDLLLALRSDPLLLHPAKLSQKQALD